MLKKNKVYLGDCLEVMKRIDDKSIDMILCDLPYGTTACKWDTIIPFEPLWVQYKRLIKDKGAIVLTASQPFTTTLISSNMDMFKQELTWIKNRPTNIFQLKNMFGNVTENIIIFSKSGATSHCKSPMKYNPQGISKSNKFGHTILKEQSVHNNSGYTYKYRMENKNYPINILFYPNTIKNRFHPTQKPVDLCEYLIKTYTNECDLVLDNCAGSGTTGIACKNINRDFILIEKEKEYYRIIKKRLEI